MRILNKIKTETREEVCGFDEGNKAQVMQECNRTVTDRSPRVRDR